ncbi:hypothetical protein CL622_04740 [archaeon]|nr:hypothetical protein [archaeon]
MGDPNDTIYPEIVRWIKPKVKRSERRLPSDGELLTEEDAQKLMEAAEHPRNKAFVATLWESGARVGEIGSLKVKNVTFDKHGTVITVMGKTGSRKIRLVLSTPYLSTWLNNHALTTEPDAPLWTNLGPIRKHKAMSYSNIRKILQTVAKKAGLKKRCNPHLFRHSRATMLANHLTEFQMNQYFGWIQGSDMPSTYVHMSGREADKAILAMNGIETQEAKQQTTLQPIICPRCETINTPDAKHCNKCAGIVNLKHALDIEVEEMKQKTVRKEADDMMDLLMRDKEVQALLSEKISQLGGIKNRHTE